jgi:hypothetical protein
LAMTRTTTDHTLQRFTKNFKIQTRDLQKILSD